MSIPVERSFECGGMLVVTGTGLPVLRMLIGLHHSPFARWENINRETVLAACDWCESNPGEVRLDVCDEIRRGVFSGPGLYDDVRAAADALRYGVTRTDFMQAYSDRAFTAYSEAERQAEGEK